MTWFKTIFVILLALGVAGGFYDFLHNGNHGSLFLGVTCFFGILLLPNL